MKRLALVLAAAASVLGTGCGPASHCARSATVDWSGGFLGSDNVVRGCADARVAEVDLFINGDVNTMARVACTSGAAQAVDLPSGSNVLTIEGVESGGRIAYRAEVSVTPTCGDQGIAVTPAEGTLALDYAFAPTNVCHAAQPSFIWTNVHDDVANETAFQDTATAGVNLCGTPLTYRLPAGAFTLIGVNEYSQSAGIVGADCTHTPFNIAGGLTTHVPATLVDSTRACF